MNSDKRYYSADEGLSWEGPFSQSEFSALQSVGIVTPSMLIRCEPGVVAESSCAAPLPSLSPPPLPPAPAGESCSVMLCSDGRQHGPYSLDEVSLMRSRGELSPNVMYWVAGMAAWHSLNELFPLSTMPPVLPSGVPPLPTEGGLMEMMAGTPGRAIANASKIFRNFGGNEAPATASAVETVPVENLPSDEVASWAEDEALPGMAEATEVDGNWFDFFDF